MLNQLLHWRPQPLLTHGGVSLLVGIGLNAAVWAGSSIFMGYAQVISVVVSSPVHDIVYFALLPPIIFEAGFSMRKRGFFSNIVPILLYAVVGTMISTLAAGVMLFGLSQIGAITFRLALGECFLFAALISPTDPVASLSVLREVQAPPALKNCIFGEATLNDALSIVLFNVIRQHFHTLSDSEYALADTVSDIINDLLYSMFGSVVTGGAFALGVAFFTRQLRLLSLGLRFARPEVAHAELSLLTMLAMLTFTASERLGFSGIASLFVCGVFTRHYTYHNLSAEAQTSAETQFLTLATMCETALATLLGVASFDYLVSAPSWNLSFAVLTLPVLFVARAMNIFPLSALANAIRGGRKPSISFPMQVVMWFSGMRGALSFALVVTLSSHPQSLHHETYQKMVAATLMTICVTTLLMAPATRPLIRSLRLGPAGDKGPLSAALLQQQPVVISTRAALASTPSPPQPAMGRYARGRLRSSPLAPRDEEHSHSEGDTEDSEPAAAPPVMHGFDAVRPSLYQRFRRFEAAWIKPTFGGRMPPPEVPGSIQFEVAMATS